MISSRLIWNSHVKLNWNKEPLHWYIIAGFLFMLNEWEVYSYRVSLSLHIYIHQVSWGHTSMWWMVKLARIANLRRLEPPSTWRSVLTSQENKIQLLARVLGIGEEWGGGTWLPLFCRIRKFTSVWEEEHRFAKTCWCWPEIIVFYIVI